MNARSKSFGSSDAPTSFAASRSLVSLGIGEFRLPLLWRAAFRSRHSVSQFRLLGLLALRSRFIGQSLPFDAEQRAVGALDVVDAEPNAIGVPEIKLGQIAVKMLLAAMLIDADHAALENAVIAFDGVGVDLLAGPRSV